MKCVIVEHRYEIAGLPGTYMDHFPTVQQHWERGYHKISFDKERSG